MPLTNHTTGLELAIALRDAGWPQEESLFYWVMAQDGSWHLQSDRTCGGFDCDVPQEWKDKGIAIASPTASELMERMPAKIDESYYLQVDKMPSFYCAYYENYADERQGHKIEKRSTLLPDALAKLTLFLVEEGKMRF